MSNVDEKKKKKKGDIDSEVKYDLWDQKYYISRDTVWKWIVTLYVQELYRWMLQLRVHIVVVREIRARIGLGRRCVESMVEYDQMQSIGSKCDTQTLELV